MNFHHFWDVVRLFVESRSPGSIGIKQDSCQLMFLGKYLFKYCSFRYQGQNGTGYMAPLGPEGTGRGDGDALQIHGLRG